MVGVLSHPGPFALPYLLRYFTGMSPQVLRILSVLAGALVCVAGVFVLKVDSSVAAILFTAGGSLLALPAQPQAMTVRPPPPGPTEIPPPP